MKLLSLCAVFAMMAWLGSAAARRAAAAVVPAELRCEYRVNPLGIDAARPRLSWILNSEERNQKQTAYQVLVASDPARLVENQADLWESGKVASDETNQIEYQGKPLASGMQCCWKVRVWDKDGKPSAWSDAASWSMGLLQKSDWQAKWIRVEDPPVATATFVEEAKPKAEKPKAAAKKATKKAKPAAKPVPPPQPMFPAPYFRKGFTLDQPVKRATLYATALGIYEVSLNGRRVGRDVLTPGWSDLRHRVYYFTYDVTGMVRSGENAVGAILGDGWYGGYLAFTGKRRFYGGSPQLLLQLEVELADGTKKVIGTDESWKAATGPIVYADLLMGVKQDACKEMPGWDASGFSDAAWKPAILAAVPTLAVQSHPGMPIRPIEELPARKMTEPKPGVFVYDLGQNMVGWVRLTVEGKAGQKVTLRHAEMLNPDGTIYITNLRKAKATDTFLLKDGPQTCEPTLTFHGFQYVEVTGLPAAPKLEDVTGVVVHSDIPRTCWFECSNPLVNKLVENIHWGQRGNYLDVPTDCPQRDERAGWTGDAQVFMKTAAFNRDIAAFSTKWLVDLCQDGQDANGAYPDVAPSILGHGNAAWEDSAVICTWRQYEMYGDRRMIERHYPNLRRYMEEHLAKVSKDYIRGVGAYGDWLLLAGPQKSNIHGTAYYYISATLMAQMAAVIGKPDDAQRYRELAGKIKQAFMKRFVHADGTISDADKKSSQTFYALAFALDLVPEELKQKAAAHFVEEIKARDWHLATGFIGTPVLLPALEKIGRADLAYRILMNDTYPSWLSQVKLGSTTMWERWDGWLPGKGFQTPGMNSFNHYWLGCVGEWLYTRVAGLDTLDPGFARVTIRPLIPPPQFGLTYAKVRYHSIRGTIESGWKLSDGKLTLEVVIPANVSATVYVPTSDVAKVEADGAKLLRRGVGAEGAVYEIGSGKYTFISEYRP